MIPEHIRFFFWDIDTEDFEPRTYPEYTIGRILEHGDEQALAWLRDIFSEREIKDVISSERRLSRKSARFWALVYRLPEEEVPALKRVDPWHAQGVGDV